MTPTASPSYRAIHKTLSQSSAAELRQIAESLANNYTQAGVTFDIGRERPFPLDLVPRVIASPEWEIIEAGVAQRVQALERFLADVYDEANVIKDGVIRASWSPPRTTSTGRYGASPRPTGCGSTWPAWI